jgi:Circadian oscillating protein COP23
MKIGFQISIASIVLSIIPIYFQSLPAIAQPQVRFYCGYTADLEPTTSIATRGNDQGNQTLVVWRYSLRNMSPQQRCDDSVKKFQAAWNRGNFHHLVAGINNTNGQGIVCAMSSRQNICLPKDALFAVKNDKEAKDITSRLFAAIQRPTVGGKPIYESSSAQSIDMQELIKFITNSGDN